MPDSVVVIIPAYNAAGTLPRQLAALDAQTDLDFRVVVSDNNSTDNIREVCDCWQPRFQALELVDASAAPGAAHARNVAIRATEDALILFCDADDRVHPGWVAAMKTALAEVDAATGPLHLVYPGEPERTEMWNADSVPTSMGFRMYIPGGNLGMRRSVVTKVGLFDEEMKRGQEDVDFGWRMVAAGLTLGHASGAAIDYYQRAGLGTLLRRQGRCGRAHAQLYQKYRHDPQVPRPAGWRTSSRWFWEWAKQLPDAVRDGRSDQMLGQATFQLGRMVEGLWRGIRTPL